MPLPCLQQMGNAVSPQVAAALGRCLALAAVHESPPGALLHAVPDDAYDLVRRRWWFWWWRWRRRRGSLQAGSGCCWCLRCCHGPAFLPAACLQTLGQWMVDRDLDQDKPLAFYAQQVWECLYVA